MTELDVAELGATIKKTVARPDELFRMLVMSVKDYAIFMLDPTGHVATWNAGAERLKGYTANEIIGRHFSAFYPEADVKAGKCEMELEHASTTGSYEDEGWRVRKDGSQFWANVVITAVRDDAGRLVGFAKVTRDLSERKTIEESRAQLLAAEQANRAKDEFLAMLGHELRNPLAPMVTALQLIKLRGGDSGLSREHQVIERQLDHMKRLVDDLLDVSRLARGKIEVSKEPIDLRIAIAHAVEIAGPLVEERGHALDVKAPNRPVMVEGDESRLTQVFANLLTNAAKYTDPGGKIAVTVRRAEADVIVEVADNGIGIEPDLLPRVFDLFVQGERDADKGPAGLGLGLALVKSLVALHGGRVEARSTGRHRGSTFTVTLPAIERVQGNEVDRLLTTAFAPAAHKRRVLVVDDNDDARILLADILAKLGLDVQSAGDAASALAVAGEFSPEVAVLDLGLPDLDGHALGIKLREMLPHIQLIALSGYGQASDQARSQEAGFQHHLVKPVDVRRLMEAIGERS